MNKNFIKKVIILAISISLAMISILPSISALRVENVFNEKTIDESQYTSLGLGASHHKVLAEFGTTTTCPYCVSHKNFLPQVAGDFQYITLVADKSGAANMRCNELGISGVPDTHFDGGYTHVLGGVSSVTPLQNAYSACQGRTVADVEITIFCIWKIDDTMKFTVIVDNLGSSAYNGHIHVYVTEIDSRWYNVNDQGYYHNALLGYAINKDFTVGPSDSWTDTKDSWTYTDITRDNILIVATVFDQSTKYADDTTVTTPSDPGGGGGGHTPVPILKISTPGEGETVNGTITISGTAHHPEGDGKLRYVLVKIDDQDWEYADGTIYWNYEWDTTTVEDGEHTISAVCGDGQKSSAIYKTNVYVQNNEPEPPPPERYPDLEAYGSISWTDISPNTPVSGQFSIENIGDSESQLNWTIEKTPQWGEWSFEPNEGIGLTPEDGPLTVDVIVVAPEEPNYELDGEIKIVNADDSSDYSIISVSLSTSKSRAIHTPFMQFLHNHPHLLSLLRFLLKLPAFK